MKLIKLQADATQLYSIFVDLYALFTLSRESSCSVSFQPITNLTVIDFSHRILNRKKDNKPIEFTIEEKQTMCYVKYEKEILIDRFLVNKRILNMKGCLKDYWLCLDGQCYICNL